MSSHRCPRSLSLCFVTFASLVLPAALAACHASSGLADGDFCMSAAECAGGACIGSVCARTCTTSADCPSDNIYAATCGTYGGGVRACGPSCDDSFGAVCVDGEPVACAVLTDDSHCETCGCASDADRCEPGVGCEPKRDVGGACSVDRDCKTDNCSGFAGVCRVPVGQPCDVTNCDLCMTADDGYAFCSRECDSSQCNGYSCLGDIALDFFTCRPSCSSFSDPSCPGQCRQSSNSSALYCDCADCFVVEPVHMLGDPCHRDEQCASGECLARTTCGGGFGDECIDDGYCSAPCSNDATCGAGNRCVDVACAAGQTEDCGGRCLPSCTDAWDCTKSACNALPAHAGGTALVCDVRHGDGQECLSNEDCTSLRCVDDRCIPSGGLPNGAVCVNTSDCADGTCASGVCRGDGVLGDACTVPADCAVGDCCTSGPNANRCASSC